MDKQWFVYTLVRSTVRLSRPCNLRLREPRPYEADLITAKHVVVTLTKRTAEGIKLKCVNEGIWYFPAWKCND